MSAVPALDPREPITREQFYALFDSGEFDDRRVELVDGRIVEKEPMGPQHGRAIRRIAAAYQQGLVAEGVADRYEVMQQSGFAMPNGGVRLPDIAVVTPEDADRLDQNPSYAFLIIEVANTSLEKDLAKAAQYAQVAQEYWVVDLVGRKTHIFKDRSTLALTQELPRFYRRTGAAPSSALLGSTLTRTTRSAATVYVTMSEVLAPRDLRVT